MTATVQRPAAVVRIQRVLCPVDFTHIAHLALRHAASLGAWYEARLTILFVRTGDRVTATERDLAAFVESAVGVHAAELMVGDGDVVSEIVSWKSRQRLRPSRPSSARWIFLHRRRVRSTTPRR